MPVGKRAGPGRHEPGSVPCRGPVVGRRVQRTTVSFAPAPRRSPSVHRGVRPIPVERSALDGSASLTDRARVPNLLPNRDVQHQGNVLWEDCERQKLPHEWTRRREGWSESGRQYRRVRPPLRPRGHRYLPGAGETGPGHGPADRHVDQHPPAGADTRATAAASSGRSRCSNGPGSAYQRPQLRRPSCECGSARQHRHTGWRL